jgi:excisionase family DNA binding protein
LTGLDYLVCFIGIFNDLLDKTSPKKYIGFLQAWKLPDIIIGPHRWNILMMDDRWISVEEIATYLGVKRDTIYKWIDRRKMPAHKVGRLWKFRKKEVDEWVKSGQAKTNQR